jgi:hypothetical protein
MEKPVVPYIVYVDFIHNDEYLFCDDPSCPCHDDQDLQADLGDALAEGRVRDNDAGRVWSGELPIRPRVA